MKQLEDMSLAELQAMAAQQGLMPQDDGLEGKSVEELQAMASSLPGGKAEIIQEMHPDVSSWDRLIAKNLSQSPQATKTFLQKQYPGLEFTEVEGQLGMRKPGEGQYRALDPEGWANLHPGELMRDVGDLGYDIGSGVGQGAATVAGAAGGGPLGAVGAGAASGAGFEALRQYAGKQMGIPQEVDGMDVALSGGMGAIDPLLFGVGKGVKGSLIREGGLRKATSKAAEIFTGVDAPVWMRAATAPRKMKAIQEAGEDNFAEASLGGLREKVTSAVDKSGKDISEKARNSGAMIDIGRSKAIVKDRIVEMRALKNRNARDNAYLGQLEDLYEKTFMTNANVPDAQNILGPNSSMVPQEMSDVVDAETAYRVRDTIDDMVDYTKDKYADQKMDKRIKGMAKNSAGDIRAQMRKLPEVEKAYGDYKQAKSDLDYLTGYLQNKKNMVEDSAEDGLTMMFDRKGEKFMKRAGAGDKEGMDILRRLDKRYKTTTSSDAQDLAASSVWENAGWFPQSLKGTTSTSRTKLGQATGALAGGYLGSQDNTEGGRFYGSVAGGMGGMLMTSPKAFKQYMRMGGVPSFVSPEVRQSVWNTMNSQEE